MLSDKQPQNFSGTQQSVFLAQELESDGARPASSADLAGLIHMGQRLV